MTAEGYTMRKCLANEYNCSYPDGTSKIDKVCIKNVKGGAKKKSKKKNEKKKMKSNKKLKKIII